MDQVTLSPTAAAQCMEACEKYLRGLDLILSAGDRTLVNAAFGSLGSGMALGGKFAGLASGQTYSLDSVLRQHIEVIQKLKAAFEAAGQRYIETDTQNAANLTIPQPK